MKLGHETQLHTQAQLGTHLKGSYVNLWYEIEMHVVKVVLKRLVLAGLYKPNAFGDVVVNTLIENTEGDLPRCQSFTGLVQHGKLDRSLAEPHRPT